MVSKTPRKSDNDFLTPMAQVFEDVDGEDNKKVEDNRVAELEAALKELREKREEERNDLLLSQPSNNGWQSQVNEQQPVYLDPKTIALPDPALDPDGYANAVQRRAEVAIENSRNKEERTKKFETDIDNKTKALWEDFEYEYPDYSDNRERVDYVATAVVKSAVAKGIDINRYMFGSGRNRFMKDVAKKYESVFGEPETDEDDYEDTRRSNRSEARASNRNRASNRSRSEDDEGRSAGVFGGNESGGRANRREVNENNAPSMIDDLQAIQKKGGFF